MTDPRSGKYESHNDERLMLALNHGDTLAFNVLYQRYNKRLMYYFYRMLGNSHEKARDFLQDLFMKIIEKPELFDTNRKFATWIFSVAHNMCKNEYRRMAVRINVMCDEDIDRYSLNDLTVNESRLTAEEIFESIDQLDDVDKTAFLLYYREDFSLQEIGKILELPEGTIKSKLFYARKKVCRKLLISNNKK